MRKWAHDHCDTEHLCYLAVFTSCKFEFAKFTRLTSGLNWKFMDKWREVDTLIQNDVQFFPIKVAYWAHQAYEMITLIHSSRHLDFIFFICKESFWGVCALGCFLGPQCVTWPAIPTVATMPKRQHRPGLVKIFTPDLQILEYVSTGWGYSKNSELVILGCCRFL